MTAISLLGFDILIAGRRQRTVADAAGGRRTSAPAQIQKHGQREHQIPHSYSFPSGHALCSFCFYAVLAGLIAARTRSLALRVAVGIMAAALVIAIGLSRIYLGMHYPSHVIAGYLAAAVWVTTLLVLDRWRLRRRRANAARGPRVVSDSGDSLRDTFIKCHNLKVCQ